jgi:hypothetical protein
MRRVWLAICLLSAGCVRDPVTLQLDQESLSVHSVLVAGEDRAAVLVTLVRASDQFGFGAAARPVTNATVRLTADGQTYQLVANQASRSACMARYQGSSLPPEIAQGCYAATVPGGLRSGVTYDLEIDAGERGLVRGRTVLPNVPQFLTPAPNTRIRLDGFNPAAPPTTVRWSGVQPKRWTELYAEALTAQCDAYLAETGETGGSNLIETMEADSVRIRLGDSGCNVPPEGMPAEFRLMAYDSNYTRYAELNFGRNATPERGASVGITGAVGVFGAAARARLPIVLTR